MEKLLDRFLRYVAVDTQSDENSDSQPSTAKQLNLLKLLCEELKQMGVQATLDEFGYVMGSIPSNIEKKVPAVGFIAHVDTAPDASGKDVKPQIIPAYDGSAIPLKGVPGLQLKPEEFPELLHYVGQTLVTTDGTTLLGADDKAGVAEIMTLCEYILAHPEVKHGKICVGFTPDEEIGRGADLFDVAGFGADFAYTLDGGEISEMEYENFNAASARILVHGFSIHPGSAKDKMRNAIRLAMEFDAMLPANERPEHTEGYEGFYHLNDFTGEVQQAELRYIIRDHDKQKFEQRKERIRKIAAYLNEKYGESTFELTLRDSYFNMKEKVQQKPEVVERAMNAIRACGLTPACVPIRGGTDGATLSYKGLVCPNLGTGSYNHHGVFEYACVQEMETMVEIVKKIVEAK